MHFKKPGHAYRNTQKKKKPAVSAVGWKSTQMSLWARGAQSAASLVFCNFIRRLLCITEANVVLFTFVWQLKLQAAILFMRFLALLIGEVTGEGPQVRLGLRATVLLLWSLRYKPFLSSERIRICWRAQKNFAVQVAQITFQTQIYNTQNTRKTPSTLLTLSP